jgi:hypothetical protein
MNRDVDPRRLGALAAVAVLAFAIGIAGAAVVLPSGGLTAAETQTNPAFDPGITVQTALPSDGQLDPSVDAEDRGGVVLIDRGHSNSVDRTTLRPLVDGLVDVGHTVRFHESGDDLEDQLSEATAFVTLTPGEEYDRSAVDAVTNFTDRGGRVLVVGEPNRIRVRGRFAQRRSDGLTTIGGALGLSFDTRYLYNMETNDGNYKNVIAEPGPDAGLDAMNRTAVYTATAVSAPEGTDLLVSTAGTHLSKGGPAGRYAVAVETGNVTALGDRDFLRDSRYTVADNEVFLAHVVEFLAEGSRA